VTVHFPSARKNRQTGASGQKLRQSGLRLTHKEPPQWIQPLAEGSAKLASSLANVENIVNHHHSAAPTCQRQRDDYYHRVERHMEKRSGLPFVIGTAILDKGGSCPSAAGGPRTLGGGIWRARPEQEAIGILHEWGKLPTVDRPTKRQDGMPPLAGGVFYWPAAHLGADAVKTHQQIKPRLHPLRRATIFPAKKFPEGS